ncbi:helix-turn-helix domain-containing protein [Riemerella anatipestifer]|uniref:helix-turn-helix domain-containing protein n=1 Tax=Riemerella anatipestifer TaxID=34085 RepID=UPI00069B61E4|nr:helix-turn-helix transcriptional regulator [Riemerella anatipestifer]MCO4304681.1 helix-turn-helix transcriptional regulator [Riemerella anatipestifer]MCO7353539.1 helix-turn-helix transcriptional regulator [Riemerella anatipestifer]MCQ4040041.1 helix-turn-helix transcriptional regulator [Riemerella anatipestifer]MCT6761669.1 helix-turn-helix transcriptional regulator [Riemerella anatipestifer]MCT6765873.1 helix-turn-helix transcriptional regulator [Riemerella anatipestifer]
MENILRLKEVLKEKGVTGKELAQNIGVAEMTISNIVNGNTFPKPQTLLDIATFLNVDIKDLFNSTKDTNNNETPLYIQNEQGDYVEVGSLRIDTLSPKKTSE